MICERCHGTRWIEVPKYENGVLYAMTEPCPLCGGQSFVHCCDGECAQPEICDTVKATEN
jgi:hypothetical protein